MSKIPVSQNKILDLEKCIYIFWAHKNKISQKFLHLKVIRFLYQGSYRGTLEKQEKKIKKNSPKIL